ncbi:MAG: c-type cytochrome [Rubrivivax sp.]|nr:c-type cytochrome [Rubrivivax sp.]
MPNPIPLLLALAGLASMTPAAMAQDAAAGAQKAQMCIGCHGIVDYKASFPEVHRVPMIAGQNAKYLENALLAYKKGERKHPTMRAIATTLGEKDMADLAAYYEQQGQGSVKTVAAVPAPPAAVQELLTKGNCASCHGAEFNKPIDPSYPKLAGQYRDYLYVALKSYQIEGNPRVGRGNAIMAAQVQQFKHAELKAIANYLGTLPPSVATVPQSRFR